MIVKLLILSILLALTLCGKLPIQAHSFNDLNYLSNLIGKGIDHYKLDLSMANRKSCEQFSTWNKSKKCYRTSQYIEEICCLAFRGDASSRPNFAYPFNVTDQFIRFLDETLANIVTFQPKRRLLFAINFQYSHSFDDFITEEFLSSLADVMAKYPHNLLMGTGSDSFILEYDRICYGKGSPECTDPRHKISKSSLFLQSGSMTPFDARDYYKRFRNFNTYYKGIDHYCQNGFPDWINKYPEFPLIFWQPSNQKQVRYVIQRFLEPGCVRRHGRNLTGMAMAINIDSEMFDVYLKRTVESGVKDVEGNLKVEAAANYSWSIWTEKLLATQRINMRVTKITRSPTIQQIFTISTDLFFTNKVLLQRWQPDPARKTLRVTLSRQHSAIFKPDLTIHSLMQDGIGHLVVLTSDAGSGGSGMKTVYYFDSESFELVAYREMAGIQAACMRGREMVYVGCAGGYCTIKGATEFQESGTYGTFNSGLFLSKIHSIEAHQGNFMIAGQSASTPDLAAILLIRDGRPVPPEIPLSLGQTPKLFRKSPSPSSPKQFGILLENSMCHSALLINNNDMNKCSFFHEPEFASLRNVRGLVNLMEFNYQDLVRNREIVSPCRKEFGFSKVLVGGNSDIVELGGLGVYLLVTEYVRIQEQDVVAALFCGGSNYDNAYRYRLKSTLMTTLYTSNRETPNSPIPSLQ